MQIMMLKTAAGPDGVWQAGLEYDLKATAAIALCEAGAAVPVVTDSRETATIKVPEKRTKRKRRKR